jgi:hypothetical protein
MLVLKRMKNHTKSKQLQCTFPKLTETNQQYVLGLAEGLKRAQNGRQIEVTGETEGRKIESGKQRFE